MFSLGLNGLGLINYLSTSSTMPVLPFYFFQPDGVSKYLRPDGTSLYLRA